MKLVLEKFKKSIKSELLAAISIDFIIKMGKDAYLENEAQIDQSLLSHGFIDFTIDEDCELSNTWKSVKDCYDFVDDNPYYLVEVFHGLMIQSWHVFLADIYAEMTYSTRHADKVYSIGKIEVNINPEELSKDYLPDAIRIRSTQKFKFYPTDKQLSIINKALEIVVDDLNPEIKKIKQEINVRNLIQHNKGIIREEDIERNNGNFTHVHQTESRNEVFYVGDRINRDILDLRVLAGNFFSIAEKMLKKEIENDV